MLNKMIGFAIIFVQMIKPGISEDFIKFLKDVYN